MQWVHYEIMDLKRLRHIIAVADHRSFARAADAIHLTQPALTRSIQAAESEFGLVLFDRGPTGVTPTPAGRFLIERARRLCHEGTRLGRDMALLKAGELGDASFGVGPFPAATILSQIMTELRSTHPKVNSRVVLGSADWLARRLVEEHIEFFIAETRDLPPNPDFVIRPLARIPAGIFVRPGHPLAGRPKATLAEIWSYGVASVRIPKPLSTHIAAALNLPAGSDPPLTLECEVISTLRDVALTSDTVLAAPALCVRDELASGRLVSLSPVDGPELESNTGVVTVRDRSVSPIAAHILSRLGALAQTLKSHPS